MSSAVLLPSGDVRDEMPRSNDIPPVSAEVSQGPFDDFKTPFGLPKCITRRVYAVVAFQGSGSSYRNQVSSSNGAAVAALLLPGRSRIDSFKAHFFIHLAQSNFAQEPLTIHPVRLARS